MSGLVQFALKENEPNKPTSGPWGDPLPPHTALVWKSASSESPKRTKRTKRTDGKPTKSGNDYMKDDIKGMAEDCARIMSAAVDEALDQGDGISASRLRPALEAHFKAAGICFDPRMNRLALGLARRRMAEQTVEAMRDATKHWSPEKLVRYSAERMRQLGELTRLTEDIRKLPPPASYAKTLAKQLEKPELETIQGAAAWLKEFAAAYREAEL